MFLKACKVIFKILKMFETRRNDLNVCYYTNKWKFFFLLRWEDDVDAEEKTLKSGN